jgi:predicted short-subunit dehydrogenase-like oxidoreductase (DUF2520 family)
MLKISFVGAGNVAHHLAIAFEKAGIAEVAEVYSKHLENAETLCSHLYVAEAKTDLDFSNSVSEIIFLAITDDVLPKVLDELIIKENTLIAHTSGSTPLSIFEPYPYQGGVFYPLQTFSKNREVEIDTVPFCIEATDKDTEKRLFRLAQKLSRKVVLMSSQERRILHIAAVFACNFVNHLLGISKSILDANALDYKLLKPLVKETIEKAFYTEPRLAQTGPAIRKDIKLIEKHLEFLQEDFDKQRIYQLLTESIMNFTE